MIYVSLIKGSEAISAAPAPAASVSDDLIEASTHRVSAVDHDSAQYDSIERPRKRIDLPRSLSSAPHLDAPRSSARVAWGRGCYDDCPFDIPPSMRGSPSMRDEYRREYEPRMEPRRELGPGRPNFYWLPPGPGEDVPSFERMPRPPRIDEPGDFDEE